MDSIDPAKPESMKNFIDLQTMRGTIEYGTFVGPKTKQHKEKQMTDRFNEWVRNAVDARDPKDDGIRKDMFALQHIQATVKYNVLAPADSENPRRYPGQYYVEGYRLRCTSGRFVAAGYPNRLDSRRQHRPAPNFDTTC